MGNLKGLNVLIVLPSVICAVAIAACGSSGHKPSASSHAQSFLAFSECMRSHGVTAFPDPQPSGGINMRLPGSSWNFGDDPHGLTVRR